MNYSRLLSHAWEITWRYKFLWVFGFILALFGGRSSSEFNYTFNGGSGSSDQPPDWLSNLGSWFGQIEPAALLSTAIAIVAVIILIGLIIAIISLVLSAVARGALIDATNSIEKNETTGFKRAFGGGWRKAMSLIGIDIVLNWSIGLLALVLIMMVLIWMLWPAIPLISESIRGNDTSSLVPVLLGTVFSGLAVLLCLVIILIPISIVLGLLFVIATNVCVIEDRGALESIGHAWGIFKKNLGPVLLVWLILVVISFVFGIVVGLPAMAAGIMLFVVLAATQFNAWVVAGVVAIGLIMALVFLLLSGILRTYSSVLWTLAYLEFEKKGLAENGSPS